MKSAFVAPFLTVPITSQVQNNRNHASKCSYEHRPIHLLRATDTLSKALFLELFKDRRRLAAIRGGEHG